MFIVQPVRLALILVFVTIFCSIALGQDDFEFESEPAAKNLKFTNVTGITFATGPEDNSVGFKFVNGVLIKNRFSLGFGIGYDKYTDESLIPLFADLRYFPGRRTNTGSLFFAAIGYSLRSRDGIKDFHKEGFYFNGGVGLILLGQGTTGLILDVGYKLQRVTENWNRMVYHGSYSQVDFFSDNVNHGFFSASAGIIF